MQSDGGLARAGSSLDGQELAEGRPDDLVLLGLNGGDDVEHLARTSSLELGQQGVAAAQPGGAGLVRRRSPKRSSATATTEPRSTMIWRRRVSPRASLALAR